MNKFTFQIFSDIHLEFYNKFPIIKPLAKYLFLAGDIGTIVSDTDKKVEKFLYYCSSNWEKTFYVLGNHEFYQTTKSSNKTLCFEELELKYQQICNKFPNVYLLNDSHHEIIPELNVYGTTLWTNPNKYIKPSDGIISDYLNDYNMITIKSNLNNTTNLLSSEFINKISDEQLCKLENYLLNSNNKTLIITHFPPIRTGSSNPKYSNQEEFLSNYFSWNNIYSKLKSDNISCWISGHTHWSYNINLSGIKFVSNQFGYKNELINGQTGFDENKIYEINY